MKKILLLAFLCLTFSLFAQQKVSTDTVTKVPVKSFKKISPALLKKEQEIKKLFNKITETDAHDSARMAINEQIRVKMAEALKDSDSFFYAFDSLKYLGKVYSDDYNIRIYTWCCELEDFSYKFYGFIQDFDNDAIYPLVVRDKPYIPKENDQIGVNNWYGALYYKAINVSDKKSKEPKYILLGWNQTNLKTKNKIMEVLSIEDEKALLGSKIFKGYKGRACRMVLSYCADLGITLNYDEKEKRFIFDHLTPLSDEKDNPLGCNGPDMSYDSLKSKRHGKRWVLKKDVDVRNTMY